MKDLSAKQWFWTLLVVMPITFYTVEHFSGDTPSSLFFFVSYIISSVLGVLLGYGLFAKGLVKIRHVNGFKVLAFAIVMALVIMLSLLVSFVGINQLGVLIFKTVILTFNSSAIILAFGCKQQ